MVLKHLLAVCLPILLVTAGMSAAFTASPGEEQTAVEVRTMTGRRSISMSVEAAQVVAGLLHSLVDAIDSGDRTAVQRLTGQLDTHGIEIDVPSILTGDTTPISNRLCVMYGAFSKALFSYPLDLAVAGVLSLFDGFTTIGLFLLCSVLTHALHPVHLAAPVLFLTVLDGSTGQLVTHGIEGKQVIYADELSTHIVFGFVGTIVNIIVPIQGAPDPAFCIGAALAITPAP